MTSRTVASPANTKVYARKGVGDDGFGHIVWNQVEPSGWQNRTFDDSSWGSVVDWLTGPVNTGFGWANQPADAHWLSDTTAANGPGAQQNLFRFHLTLTAEQITGAVTLIVNGGVLSTGFWGGNSFWSAWVNDTLVGTERPCLTFSQIAPPALAQLETGALHIAIPSVQLVAGENIVAVLVSYANDGGYTYADDPLVDGPFGFAASIELIPPPSESATTRTLRPIATSSEGVVQWYQHGILVANTNFEHEICVNGWKQDKGFTDRSPQDDVIFLHHIPAGGQNPDTTFGQVPNDIRRAGILEDLFFVEGLYPPRVASTITATIHIRARTEGGSGILGLLFADYRNGKTLVTDLTITGTWTDYTYVVPVHPVTGAPFIAKHFSQGEGQNIDYLDRGHWGIRGYATGPNIRVGQFYLTVQYDEDTAARLITAKDAGYTFPPPLYYHQEVPYVLSLCQLDSFCYPDDSWLHGTAPYTTVTDGVRTWSGVIATTNHEYMLSNNRVDPCDYVEPRGPYWTGGFGAVTVEHPNGLYAAGRVALTGHTASLEQALGDQSNGGIWEPSMLSFRVWAPDPSTWPDGLNYLQLFSGYRHWDVLASPYKALMVRIEVDRQGRIVINRDTEELADFQGANIVTGVAPGIFSADGCQLEFFVAFGNHHLGIPDHGVTNWWTSGVSVWLNGILDGHYYQAPIQMDSHCMRTIGDFGGAREGYISFIILGSDVVAPPPVPHNLTVRFGNWYMANTNFNWGIYTAAPLSPYTINPFFPVARCATIESLVRCLSERER
jgi:hypothetical protein